MNLRGWHSIRIRIALPVTLTLVVLCIFAMAAGYTVLQDALSAGARERGAAIGRKLAVLSREPLLVQDVEALIRILQDERNTTDDFSYAFILDERGEVLAHSFTGGFPIYLLTINRLAPGTNEQVVSSRIDGVLVQDFAAPIVLGGRTIGTARIGISRASFDRAVTRYSAILVAVFCALIAIGTLLTMTIADRLGRPVSRLVRAAREMTGGNLDVRVEAAAGSGDEIAALGETFNVMAATLKEARTHLEEKVRMATADLVKEVAEREDIARRLEGTVDELRASQAELIRAKERAESADRLKSAFLATMSHELRTPLNSIIGFTGLLMQELPGTLNAEQKKQMNLVQAAARHLLALINDILDISKIEAGQMKIAREPFDLRSSLEKAVAVVRPLGEKKGLGFLVEIDAAVGRTWGDARRVEQIVMNLLSNAVKFTERGFVAVDCSAQGGTFVITVRDTGIGIRPEDMDILFRPFQQVDSGLSRRFEGTGLGLSISRKLAEMMGGTIRASSVPGEGSTFTVILPRVTKPAEDLPLPAAVAAAVDASPGTAAGAATALARAQEPPGAVAGVAASRAPAGAAGGTAAGGAALGRLARADAPGAE